MAGSILQLGCTIMCQHGGTATVTNTNMRVTLGGNPALLATDMYTITGCMFAPGGTAHPCVTVRWTTPSQRLAVGGKPVVLDTSAGQCIAADGGIQGSVILTGVQTRANGM